MSTEQHFYSDISQFEPLMPAETGELEDLALEVTQRSASLARELPAATLDGVRELLRVTNSYYSNRIEGNNTHPVDVERAMRADYENDPTKRDKQQESLIHIEVQKLLEERLKERPEINVCSADFLRWIHKEFYDRMPASRRWVIGDDGAREFVEAGELRTRMVSVGKHLPPVAESIEAFLTRFENVYSPEKLHGTRKFIALAASHHRLAWIHPFLDGNGRVTRLFTDAYFFSIPQSGYGLWNVSRGLARRNDSYKAHLDAADFPREGDLDGRGNLSNRTLTEFCKFFLEVCLDQAEYMSSVLQLDEFLSRLETYVTRRASGNVVDEKGRKSRPLHAKAGLLLREAAIAGELPRGKVAAIIGMSERSGRSVVKELIDEGLLIPTSGWHQSPLRLGFPPHAARYWFPDLMPDLPGEGK